MGEQLRWLERDDILCKSFNKVYVGTDLRCNVHYKCSICDQDKELFPDKVFIKPRNRFNEATPLCGCDKGCRYNEYEINILAKRYCEKSGKNLHHQVGKCSGVRTKFKVSCLNPVCKYEQVTSLDSLSRSFNCIKCRTWKKPTQESTDRFIKKFKESGYYIEGTEFRRNDTKTDSRGCYSYWDVYCPASTCEDWFVSPVGSVNVGYKSCRCTGSKGFNREAEKGYFYLNEWSLPNGNSFLKQGITSSSCTAREHQQKGASNLDYTKILQAEGNPKEIESLEKDIINYFKQLIESSDHYEKVPHYIFPDGYTETIVNTQTFNYVNIKDYIVSVIKTYDLQITYLYSYE